MVTKKFENLSLATADLSYRAYGSTIEQLFENAAYGLFSQITNLRKVEPVKTVKVEVEGADQIQLLHDWLGDLLRAFSIDHMLLCEFTAELKGNRLKGAAKGENYMPKKHGYITEVKAVTYHDMDIKQEKGVYSAIVVCDM